ncbi:MAG TPA: SRPBCC family protein [Vicinamibacterales bacterium]
MLARNIGTWQRVGSVAGGLALLYAGGQRPATRGIARVAGVGLLARGLSGYCPMTAARGGMAPDDTKVALSGRRGVHVHERVTIQRPRDEVYRFWRQLSNLPRFMKHLERVDEIDGRRSHWVAKAPFGRRVEWDAEIINEVDNELIGWRSLPGGDVVTAGSVRFEDRPGGATDVIVHLQYEPPAGRLGAWVASMVREEPSKQIRDDLRRLQWCLETGEIARFAH